MIKTIAILTMTAALATSASAAEVRVSLVGKDEATLKADILQAAQTVCAEDDHTLVGMYYERMCISQTVKDTESKIEALKSASIGAPEQLASR
jgi:hypothetical protein